MRWAAATSRRATVSAWVFRGVGIDVPSVQVIRAGRGDGRVGRTSRVGFLTLVSPPGARDSPGEMAAGRSGSGAAAA